MMKVAALTQGRFVPSSRFRVRQNIPNLKKLGIEVTEYFSKINSYAGVPFNLENWSSHARLPIVGAWQGLKIGLRMPHVLQTQRHHVTWLQRELLPGNFTMEKLLKFPMVFDVDDAIWLGNPYASKNVSKIASYAAVIVAGNQYIADWFSAFNSNVVIVPTAIDVNYFSPAEDSNNNFFTIGWIGTSSNQRYLEIIRPALNAFLRRHNDALFYVISDQVPALSELPERQLRYVIWSEMAEVKAIQMMDVGIMPLPDDEWARGKCSFKMLQYMACGIPVVVSPVGMNAAVLSLDDVGFGASTRDEWFDAFEYSYQNRAAGREMGKRGRDVVVAGFSTDIISQKLAETFRALG